MQHVVFHISKKNWIHNNVSFYQFGCDGNWLYRWPMERLKIEMTSLLLTVRRSICSMYRSSQVYCVVKVTSSRFLEQRNVTQNHFHQWDKRSGVDSPGTSSWPFATRLPHVEGRRTGEYIHSPRCYVRVPTIQRRVNLHEGIWLLYTKMHIMIDDRWWIDWRMDRQITLLIPEGKWGYCNHGYIQNKKFKN